MPRRDFLGRKVGAVVGHCKIRKRVSSSPSPSSVLVRSYRLKRPVLVAKKMALRSPVVDKGKEAQMSARRLAATLWEFNGGAEEEKENLKGTPSHSPLCKKGWSKHRRRSSDKLQLIEFDEEGMNSPHHGVSAKVPSPRGVDTGPASITGRLKDVSTSLTASKELVKVLLKMWCHEEQNSSRLTLVSALRVEIERARHQVEHVMHEKRYSQKEIDALLKHLASEKEAWKSREQERISSAVSLVTRELAVERKLRRQTERLNKTLGRELADTREQLSKAEEELGCERRAREILEKTCDELANGLGDDRGEVEAMKRECERVREETEREKQMLQVADVLREERVQMKLADARYEYEEKNAALDSLRSELESYIGGIQREDSGEIELSMDSLGKSYKWSFGHEGSAADPRRPLVDEMFKGRRSLCEKVQWESVCLNNNRRANANGSDNGRLSEERNNHRSIKGRGDQVLLSGSSGDLGSSDSRPRSPPDLRGLRAYSIGGENDGGT